MKYQHFLYLPMAVAEPNQNALPQGKEGSFIGGVSTMSSSAFGCTYTGGAQYSYEDRVLFTVIDIIDNEKLIGVTVLHELEND